MNEAALLRACEDGDVAAVESILREHPEVDVNKFGMFVCPLYVACTKPEIVSLLLTRPDLNVNVVVLNYTPLMWSCLESRSGLDSLSETVKRLLQDPRVLLEPEDDEGDTFLDLAAKFSKIIMIEYLIIIRPELAQMEAYVTHAIDIARRNVDRSDAVALKYYPVYELLKNFWDDPVATRYRVRLNHGHNDEIAAEFFAIVVFLSDDLLRRSQHHPTQENHSGKATFLAIASRLPIELQMVLCCRAARLAKDNISSKDAEAGLRWLAKIEIKNASV